MHLQREADEGAWGNDFQSGQSDQQLKENDAISARELSVLMTKDSGVRILRESEICKKSADLTSSIQLKDSRRSRRNIVDFTLVARTVGAAGRKGKVTDIGELGFQLRGLPAEPGESTDLEILTDWRPNDDPVLVETVCRWSDNGVDSRSRKAGFQVVEVKQGNFHRLLEDVSPLSLSQIKPADLNSCPGMAEAGIDSDYLVTARPFDDMEGLEGKISRVRLLRFLDILPIPCLLIDHTGHIIHVNKYAGTVSPITSRLTGRPSSSMFLDQEEAAKLARAAAAQAVVQAKLRIEEIVVHCQLESRALGNPDSGHLLVFVKPLPMEAETPLAQSGDTRPLLRVPSAEGRSIELPEITERLITCPTSDPLNASFGGTPSQPMGGASPEALEMQIDREAGVDSMTVSGEAIVPKCRRYAPDHPGALGDKHLFTATRGAASSLSGFDEPPSVAGNAIPSLVEPNERPRSKVMRELLEKCRVLAKTESIVLLLGESGSGKDYLARFIHNHSGRSEAPFKSVNCAAVPGHLAESEFFGHEEGAFTGAHTPKRGMLELAPGGTLLLNEIGHLPLVLQSKLLTFLDSGRFFRVGGQSEVSIDSRIIAAANQDLREEVRMGNFRADLFFRLNVLPIKIPPLRERMEDLPILIEELTADLARKLRFDSVPLVSIKTLRVLQNYHWPGNVRELKNRLERSLVHSGGRTISLSLMFDRTAREQWAFNLHFPEGGDLNHFKKEVMRRVVTEALVRSGGKRQVAARLLGITRYSLKRQMTNLGLMENANE